MGVTRLTRLELQVMEALWSKGAISIREILEDFPARRRPAYTTVQTTVYRLETKGAVRRASKVGNAHIFEAMLSRSAGQQSFFQDLLLPLAGHGLPVVSYLIKTGKLTLKDVEEAERHLRQMKKGK
jgi:BlaI family penicillinase repressor